MSAVKVAGSVIVSRRVHSIRPVASANLPVPPTMSCAATVTMSTLGSTGAGVADAMYGADTVSPSAAVNTQ